MAIKDKPAEYAWKKTLNHNGHAQDWALYGLEGQLVAHVFAPEETPTHFRVMTWRADGSGSHEDVITEKPDDLKDLILMKAKMGALR